ncbi:MAG TPA: hypothetical protein VF981_08040 [Gemmatimonadaceae bacterium]
MPVLGEILIGDQVEIEFVASPNNIGTTIITSGYVPRAGVEPPSVAPPSLAIAPGASATQTTTVGKALSLRIVTDIPDIGGGQLTVRVNGTVKDGKMLTRDETWSYVVV